MSLHRHPHNYFLNGVIRFKRFESWTNNIANQVFAIIHVFFKPIEIDRICNPNEFFLRIFNKLMVGRSQLFAEFRHEIVKCERHIEAKCLTQSLFGLFWLEILERMTSNVNGISKRNTVLEQITKKTKNVGLFRNNFEKFMLWAIYGLIFHYRKWNKKSLLFWKIRKNALLNSRKFNLTLQYQLLCIGDAFWENMRQGPRARLKRRLILWCHT